jgi:hypothetical protein
MWRRVVQSHTDDYDLDTHRRENQISQISHIRTYLDGRVIVNYMAHNISWEPNSRSTNE